MGLDITGSSNVRYLSEEEEDEMEALGEDSMWDIADEKGYHRVYSPEGMDRSGGRDGQWYTATALTEETDFRAGSYSGYNHWRDWLSDLVLGVAPEAVWESPESHTSPFVKLINFSDCEGDICTEVCEELYRAFADHYGAAERATKADEYMGEHNLYVYSSFMEAFRLGAQNGVVRFR